MIICDNCQHENEADAIVCANCGNSLPFEGGGEIGGVPPALANRLLIYLHGYAEPLVVEDFSEIVLGRSGISTGDHPTVDLRDFAGQDQGVSRRHATVQRDGDGIYIADLNSANGTFVNGNRLSPRVRYPLHDGDEVYLGQLALYIYFD